MSEQGWIKLHRKIRTNGLWPNNKKYSPLEAWLDLLLSANHNGNKILVDGNIITIKRGEFITSILKLSERWGWHRTTTKKFLTTLENEKMLTQKCTTKYTSITIVNYELYQGDCTTECTNSVQQNVQQNVHKQECKELKNEKKIYYAEFVKMTSTEYQKLIGQFGEVGTKERIERLNLYKGSTGKKYASDYLTILNWERKNNKQNESEQGRYADL